MKIRTGFVTNSSSTSYILVVKDEAPKGYFSLLDLLRIALSRTDLEAVDEHGGLYFSKGRNYDDRTFKILDFDNYISSAQNKVDFAEEEIPELEAEIAKAKLLLEQDDIVIEAFANEWDVKQGKSRVESGRQELQDKINWRQRSLDQHLKGLAEAKKTLETLTDVKGDDLTLLFIDVDHWGGSGIVDLIERSGATIIKKEVT